MSYFEVSFQLITENVDADLLVILLYNSTSLIVKCGRVFKEFLMARGTLYRQGISAHKLTFWVTQNFNVSEQRPYVDDQKIKLGIFTKWPYVT